MRQLLFFFIFKNLLETNTRTNKRHAKERETKEFHLSFTPWKEGGSIAQNMIAKQETLLLLE